MAVKTSEKKVTCKYCYGKEFYSVIRRYTSRNLDRVVLEQVPCPRCNNEVIRVSIKEIKQ